MGELQPAEVAQVLLRADALSRAAGRDRGAPRGGRGSSFGSGRYDHVVDLAERSRLTGVRSNARMAWGANVAVPVASVAFPGSPGLGPFSPVRPEQVGTPDGGADRLAGGAGPLGSPG